MKIQIFAFCFFMIPVCTQAQWWEGSQDLYNEITRHGNVRANGLLFGRYGGGLVNDTNPYQLATNDSESHDLLIYGNASAILHFRLYDGDLKIGPNPSPNIVLYNNGNANFGNKVAIGHSNPAGRLHVAGSTYIGNENGNALYRISLGGSGGSYGSIGYGFKYTLNSDEYRYNTDDLASQLEFASGGFTFKTAPTGITGSVVNFTNAMRIQQDGRVGIGTTAPDAKLAVNGTIHSQEVKVDMTGWPDYVFQDGYQLRPLLEVQQFISENHHLPEVPSEKEVLANGQNLGEMNAILLKKIEELTLYVIEQQAQIDTMQKEISKLKIKE